MQNDRSSASILTPVDRRILDAIQSDFPLEPRPFRVLAQRLGVEEDEVLARLRATKEYGIVRQIGAIFDSNALGHKSVLLAFRVPRDRIEEAARRINEHPGISHNYERDHPYAIWSALTVPPDSDPRAHAEALARAAGAEAYLFLPAIRVFKIGVNLRMAEDEGGGGDVRSSPLRPPSVQSSAFRRSLVQSSAFRRSSSDTRLPEEGAANSKARAASGRRPGGGTTNAEGGAASAPCPLSERDREAVRILQTDLPLVSAPFATLTIGSNFTESLLLERARAFLHEGMMRRYAAVLRHRKAGYTHNIMSVWAAPDDRVEEAGAAMAAVAEVSHCYQRPTGPDWPYSLFAMLHARSEQAALAAVHRIAEATGIREYRLLKTVREFKKERVRYFTPEIGEWEKRNLPG